MINTNIINLEMNDFLFYLGVPTLLQVILKFPVQLLKSFFSLICRFFSVNSKHFI